MINKNNYKAFYTLLYIVTISLLMVAIDVHAHDLRFNVTRLSAKDGHPRRHEQIRRLSISELLKVQQQCETEKLLLDIAAHQWQHPRTNLGIHPEQYPVLLRSGGGMLLWLFRSGCQHHPSEWPIPKFKGILDFICRLRCTIHLRERRKDAKHRLYPAKRKIAGYS